MEAAREGRLAALALAALLAAIAFAAAQPAYSPTHDGPQHVYALHVANHLDVTAIIALTESAGRMMTS